VHFQHTLYLGNDMITEVRHTLPDAPILFTLHEFSSICHNNGQLVRTGSGELCLEASPRRCNECFSEVSPQTFFLRKRLIRSHQGHVDLFLAPSEFLLERYVDWGIPREKIRFEEYGRRPVLPVPETEEPRRRNRFAFFGQFLPYKGVTVLLRAMQVLSEEDVDAHLWLHGSNLELQSQDFQDEFNGLLAATSDNVTLSGPYRGAETPRLMAEIDWVVVPSVWWENSPLVIQEAFQNGRPVICSDVGGMAEKVTNGVNGLHFRVADPQSLAATITRAASSPDLWRKLRDEVPDIYDVRDHVAALTSMYEELLARRLEEVPA
jgi:glycosyltransferase involved in cell wall biosynthesis